VRVQTPPARSWKGIAAATMVAAVVSVSFTAFFIARRSGQTPREKPAMEETEELRGLRQSLRDREREIGSLRDLSQSRDESTKYDKYLKQIEELRAERDRAHEETARAQEAERQVRLRVEAAELAAAAPAPGTPAPAAPPAEPAARPATVADVAEKCTPSVVVVVTDTGAGAGFFIDPSGWAVTNYHVVAGSKQVQIGAVVGNRRVLYAGRVMAVDAANDLALVKATAPAAVPVLALGTDERLRPGDPVVAIGNPGVGGELLEHSVSNGILSSAGREFEGRKLLQTTAPINPGNSGGPLLSMTGKVIGVVTAKAVDKENIGFAVPVSLVQTLFAERDGRFRVSGTLAEWELKNGVVEGPKHDPAKVVALDEVVSRMAFDEDADRILALAPAKNEILLASISQKKVTGRIFTGSDPSDFQVAGGGKQVWVANSAGRNLVRIDLGTQKVVETAGLSVSPVRIVLAGGNLWILGSATGLSVWSVSEKKEYPVPNLVANSIGYDAKRDRLLMGQVGGITEADPDKLLAVAKQSSRAKTPQDRVNLQNETRKILKTHALTMEGYARAPTLLVDDKNGKLFYNRAAVKLDKLDTSHGVFKPNPYSRSNDLGARIFLERYPIVDQVQAVSPNGKWAVTGTHLYSAERYTVEGELPIPSLVMAFSKDSKTLWFFDFISRVLVPLPVEEGK
jgi:S1-C subfamily serine protease